MTHDSLRDALNAKPFLPFRLRMSDGREYNVQHPELIWFPPNRARTAAIALPRGGIGLIDLLHIASIVIDEHGDEGEGESKKAG